MHKLDDVSRAELTGLITIKDQTSTVAIVRRSISAPAAWGEQLSAVSSAAGKEQQLAVSPEQAAVIFIQRSSVQSIITHDALFVDTNYQSPNAKASMTFQDHRGFSIALDSKCVCIGFDQHIRDTLPGGDRVYR
jgi:hypothetical protein